MSHLPFTFTCDPLTLDGYCSEWEFFTKTKDGFSMVCREQGMELYDRLHALPYQELVAGIIRPAFSPTEIWPLPEWMRLMAIASQPFSTVQQEMADLNNE